MHNQAKALALYCTAQCKQTQKQLCPCGVVVQVAPSLQGARAQDTVRACHCLDLQQATGNRGRLF